MHQGFSRLTISRAPAVWAGAALEKSPHDQGPAAADSASARRRSAAMAARAGRTWSGPYASARPWQSRGSAMVRSVNTITLRSSAASLPHEMHSVWTPAPPRPPKTVLSVVIWMAATWGWLWHRLLAPGAAGVRVWPITSADRRPLAGRSPPERANVAYALLLAPATLQLAEGYVRVAAKRRALRGTSKPSADTRRPRSGLPRRLRCAPCCSGFHRRTHRSRAGRRPKSWPPRWRASITHGLVHPRRRTPDRPGSAPSRGP